MQPPSLLRRFHHLLLQALDFAGRAPSIQITAAAASELKQRIAEETEIEAVAALLWVTEFTKAKQPKPACWRVGFYDKWTRGWGRIHSVAGVPFVFAQNQNAKLEGATLDFCDGRFVVIDRA